jgi:hypothetical protein
VKNVVDSHQDEIDALQEKYAEDVAGWHASLEEKRINYETYVKAMEELSARLDAAMGKVHKEQAQDQHELAQSWAQAGVQAGTAFAGGIKSYLNSKDPIDIFKGLLSAAGSILSMIPGLNIVGAAISGIGGLLHGGGQIGPIVTAHAGVSLAGPSVRNDETIIKAQRGEGVVSKIGMGGLGTEGLDQLNRTGRLPASGGNVYNQIVSALDTPSYSAFAPRTVEPVSKQRVQDYAGSLWLKRLQQQVGHERRFS